MRFEETLNDYVARFPETRTYRGRETVPYVSHEEIAEGIAHGRRLHARFCRQAARATLVAPTAVVVRFIAHSVAAAVRELNKDRLRRDTIRKLSALEDWRLRDIGIERSDIRSVAKTLAYTDTTSEPTAAATAESTPTVNPFETARAA